LQLVASYFSFRFYRTRRMDQLFAGVLPPPPPPLAAYVLLQMWGWNLLSIERSWCSSSARGCKI